MTTNRLATVAVVQLVSLISVWRAAAATPDDMDGDGVLDRIDNCVSLANPLQRDTDRDGFGNACDGDFDNDGWVDEADYELLLAVMEEVEAWSGDACFSASCSEPSAPPLEAFLRDFDLDEDRRISESDLARMELLVGAPPGPRLDSDGDGVADGDDLCDGGALSTYRGCSAAEVLTNAESFWAPATARLAELHDASAQPELDEGLDVWADLVGTSLDGALAAATMGQPCAALDAVGAAQAQLEESRAWLDSVPIDVGDEYEIGGDVEPSTIERSHRQRISGQIATVDSEVSVLASTMSELCEGAEPFESGGLITKIDDSRHMLELDHEASIGFGLGSDLGPGISEGVDVAVDGVTFTDGSTLGFGIVGEEPTFGPPPTLQCVSLRFAPYQDPTLAPVLHAPNGYFVDGVHQIEGATKLAALDACPPQTGSSLTYTRESLRIYAKLDNGTWIPVAPDLDGNDGPIALPAVVRAQKVPFDLIVENRRQSCAYSTGTCTAAQTTGTQVYRSIVRATGSYCNLEYSQTHVDVDDRITGDFRTTEIASFFLPYGSGSGVSVLARGRAPDGSGAEISVGVGTPFAIHNYDYHLVHNPGGFKAIASALASGSDHAMGLAWPRIAGSNDGAPFQYACGAPTVVRDVIDYCQQSPFYSYFRLPFGSDDTGWTQGQGSLSGGTHGMGYAYDMGAACGSVIRAPRAGVVVFVDQDESRQDGCVVPDGVECDPCDQPVDCMTASCCPTDGGCWANGIKIRHQDGSQTEIFHMPMNSIVPSLGEVVQRGDMLATVGVTGNTTGPHQHIAWRMDPAGLTTKMLYEAIDPETFEEPNPALLTCYEPKQSDVLRSSNE